MAVRAGLLVSSLRVQLHSSPFTPFISCCYRQQSHLSDEASDRNTRARGLPEVVLDVEDTGGSLASKSISQEELKGRQSNSVQAWLEHRFGIEKVELVKLLQLHGVVVKGGPEGGQQLVDALLEWKLRGAKPP